MNLFQLILHDPSHRSQLGLNTIQSNWGHFLNHLNRLPNASKQQSLNIVNEGKHLWLLINQSTPQITKVLRQYYINLLEGIIKNTINQKIQNIKRSNSTQQNKLFEIINEIHQLFAAHVKYIEVIDENNHIINRFTQKLAQTIKSYQIDSSLNIILTQSFRKHCLTIFVQDIIDFEETIKNYITSLCQNNNTKLAIDFNLIKIILQNLMEMNLFDVFFEKTFYMLIRDCQNLLINCTDLQQNSKFLTNTLNYHRTFQKSFIKKLKTHDTQKIILSYSQQIEESCYFLCAKYCSKRILDIVLDFPDSQNVIFVLKKCLDKSNLLNEVSQQLINQVQKRLLIPGVITQNILNQFLNMLKVLQLLDPHGIIFQKITVPIKNYLLKRNDTLRCIISLLTDDGQNYQKLTKDIVKIPSKQYIDQASSDEDEKAAQQWQVLNVKESKTKIRIKYQQIDLVTVLVNLYGSQESFITEYQNMLAQKLMSARDYNIQEEIRNIQLLKMRFGQNTLQMCNVIVKDVKDSKKNDAVIHKQIKIKPHKQISLDKVNCLAVSKGYWPISYENTGSFNIPQEFKKVFQQYSEAFSKIKAMRKIHFHYNLGHVNLTLSFKNGNFDFKCLPIQAVMINFFDETKIKQSNGISSEELSSALHIAPNIIKQKMSFWVHKGVVKQIRMPKVGLSLKRMNSIQDGQNVYYKPVQQYNQVVRDDLDQDLDSSIAKQNTSMQSHLKHIIEGLIISILNINGPKPSQKIHLLLKTVYKTDLDYAYGEAQTIQILKKMIVKKKIFFDGENYSSKPK